ncbi:hypothetical protein HYT18_03020 [Candidatus Microgenomates bacterium]|nr:hypothetical protein [Candidatus Microgenomates bacterium]
MGDAVLTGVEVEQNSQVLSEEEVRETAASVKGTTNRIISGWPEYKTAHTMDKGESDTLEFQRAKGLAGEGLWVVTAGGPSTQYSLSRGGQDGKEKFVEDWQIGIQQGGKGVYKESIISASRIRTKDNQVFEKEEPSPNTNEATELVLKFVKEINGGQAPPELVKLQSSQSSQLATVGSGV